MRQEFSQFISDITQAAKDFNFKRHVGVSPKDPQAARILNEKLTNLCGAAEKMETHGSLSSLLPGVERQIDTLGNLAESYGMLGATKNQS